MPPLSTQEVLMKNLPKKSNEVNFGKTLTGIEACPDGAGVLCQFSDGSCTGPFDLVVGCDGIKSAAKEYIEKNQITKDPSKREGPDASIYMGIRIRYAVQDDSDSSDNGGPQTLQQFFADGAFALVGKYGNGKNRPPCSAGYLIYLDDDYLGPFKKKGRSQSSGAVAENADWSQDRKRSTEETQKGMLAQVSQFNVPTQDVSDIAANAERFFDLGVYFHNPFSFAGWSKEVPSSNGAYVALCGDAAHAMPPFLGQGSNQAVQDAFCLASKVLEYNDSLDREKIGCQNTDEDESPTHKDLGTLLKEYEKTRWLPTASITLKAAILGYLETGGPNGFYSKFRDAFFLVLSRVGVATKVLLDAATPKV